MTAAKPPRITTDPVLAALRQARIDRDMSQAQLAELVGVRQQHISTYENGTVCPSLRRTRDIAAALDYDLTLSPKLETTPTPRGVIVTDGPTEPFPATYETRP